MNELMDKFYEKTELSDVIYEQCPILSGKIIKAKFGKHNSLLKPPMNIGTFLQISEYNGERYEYLKINQHFPSVTIFNVFFS